MDNYKNKEIFVASTKEKFGTQLFGRQGSLVNEAIDQK